MTTRTASVMALALLFAQVLWAQPGPVGKHLAEGFLVDSTVVWSPAPGNQHRPGVVFDGTNFLVCWSDTRDGYRIYATRVTPDAGVIDSAGFLVTDDAAYNHYPDAALGDSTLLVVWFDRAEDSICAARVTKSGTVLDPDGITLPTLHSWNAYPRTAYNGAHWLVTWYTEYGIYGARVDESGCVLDTIGFRVSTRDGWPMLSDMTSDGVNCLVAWQRRDTAQGVIVGRDGGVGGPIVLASPQEGADRPGVAFDGTNYLAVWSERDRGIRGRRISTAGVVLDTTPVLLESVSATVSPSLSFNGRDYVVTWAALENGRCAVRAARITPDLEVLDSAGVLVRSDSAHSYRPDGASSDSVSLIAWGDTRFGWSNADIFGARFSSEGEVLDSTHLQPTASPHWQENPAATCAGSTFLVVWTDHREGEDSTSVRAVRIGNAGLVLDPEPVLIESGPWRHRSPATAAGDSCYLVTWYRYIRDSSNSALCRRVAFDGSVLDTGATSLFESRWYRTGTAVAFGDSLFIVVCGDYRNLYARTVSQSGLVGEPVRIDTFVSSADLEGPEVVFNGASHLVVWSREYGYNARIYGARLTRTGALLDTGGFLIADSAYSSSPPAVAADDECRQFLAVWANSSREVWATRISADGQVLDTNGILLSEPGAEAYYPSACWDGSYYLVAWAHSPGYPVASDVRGARVSNAGVVVDTFTVEAGPGHQFEPALAAGQEGQVLAAYTGWTPFINGKPANTRRIWAKLWPFLGASDRTGIPGASHGMLVARPSPARGAPFLSYHLARAGRVRLSVYNVLGQEVRSLVDGVESPGGRTLQWDRTDNLGRLVSPGTYFIRLRTDDATATRKVLLTN